MCRFDKPSFKWESTWRITGDFTEQLFYTKDEQPNKVHRFLKRKTYSADNDGFLCPVPLRGLPHYDNFDENFAFTEAKEDFPYKIGYFLHIDRQHVNASLLLEKSFYEILKEYRNFFSIVDPDIRSNELHLVNTLLTRIDGEILDINNFTETIVASKKDKFVNIDLVEVEL